MDFTKTIAVAASGLRAQAGRMRVISENIANADSTAPTADGEPYRRRIATFTSQLDRELEARVTVGSGRARPDMSEFISKHQPSHPAADAKGYVKYPNVNPLVEMTDMREAQRSYEANMNVIGAARRMIQRTLEYSAPDSEFQARRGLNMATPGIAANAYAQMARLSDPSGIAGALGKAAGNTEGANFIAGAQGRDRIELLRPAPNRMRRCRRWRPGKANVLDVVTAVAETEVAIDALVAVRDKVVQAYEEIMRMPI